MNFGENLILKINNKGEFSEPHLFQDYGKSKKKSAKRLCSVRPLYLYIENTIY